MFRMQAGAKPLQRGTNGDSQTGRNEKSGARRRGGGEMEAKHGVVLQRAEIEGGTRNGRTMRTRRWTTLGEIGLEGGGRLSRRVEVAVAVQRVRGDYRVVGGTRSGIERRCDRCDEMFEEVSKGKFEVWLGGGEDGEVGDLGDLVGEGGAEAVEGFGMGVVEVDLGAHVRDAVWLGMPTRAICGEDCKGVWDAAETEEEEEEEWGGEGKRIGDREVGEKLRELKRRLELQGL